MSRSISRDDCIWRFLDCADAELIVVRPGAAFNSGGLCTDPELIGVRSRAVFNCGLVLVDYIDAML